MKWTSEAYWLKAKRYCDRGHDAAHSNPDFQFFCAMALEFLSRAALAHVHPALIADGQGDTSVLYAFGFTPKGQPKTVDMLRVVERLKLVVPDFETHVKDVSDITYRRNSELHTGELAFEGVKESAWLAGFYAVASCLCAFMGRDLSDLLGDQVETARRLIIAHGKKKHETVFSKIKAFRSVFESKTESERSELVTAANVAVALGDSPLHSGQGHYPEKCPACQTPGRKLGTLSKESDPVLNGDRLQVEKTYFAHLFQCIACGLRLDGAEEINVAGMEPRFTTMEEYSLEDGPEYEYMDM